jgi:hypothetical protein
MGTEPGPHWTDSDLELVRRTSPSPDLIADAASERGAEDEAKSSGSGLFGRAVGILGAVAFFLSFVFDWGSWVLWGVIGIGVASVVARWLGRIVMRRRRKLPNEEAFLRHGMRLETKGPSTGEQVSSPNTSQGPVSGLRGNTLPKRI